MRAPRWLKRFTEWRWASFVALLIAALAFVALALLFIPQQLGGSVPITQSSRVVAAPAVAAPALRNSSLFAAQPAERAPVTVEARPVAPPEPLPTTVPVAPEIPPAPPNYAANNADRGDRPGSVEAAR